MKDNNAVSWAGSGVTMITALLTTDVLQIILTVIGIISAIVSLAYNIYQWYRKAKEDGKITPDEVEELVDTIKENTNVKPKK